MLGQLPVGKAAFRVSLYVFASAEAAWILLGAPDVANRAVDRGAVDGRVMPDGDRVVALTRLELLENDHPVIEMIHDGEGMFVRRKQPGRTPSTLFGRAAERRAANPIQRRRTA